MCRMSCQAVLVLLGAASLAFSLDNGVARTPPMGFSPYNIGICNVKERQWKSVALAMTRNGMKDAGYLYVNTDCGINGANIRDANGLYTWSASMFPSGLPAVWDYVHSLGMKAGLYIFPPHQNHEVAGNIEKDAPVFASWGCDYLKYDGWAGTNPDEFTRMRDALAATGRPIVYSVNGASGGTICNMWRTSGDIDATWESITGCIMTNSQGQGRPGSWPDPDMMEVGNLASDIEDMTHFSLWCVTSSPLIAGNDVRVLFESTRYILCNTEVIAVNQDTAFSVNPSYGGAGKLVKTTGSIQLWCKTVTGGTKAALLVNTGTSAASGTVTWTDIGLAAGTAQVRDLWEHRNLGSFTNSYTAQIPGHGCAFVKIVAGTTPIPEPSVTWPPKPADPVPVTPLAKTGWTATASVGQAAAFIDGSISTPVLPGGCGTENWVAIDMKTAQTFNCVILATRSSTSTVIKPYTAYASYDTLRLYVSSDGTNWGSPVYSGFVGPHNYGLMMPGSRTARYLKIAHKPGNTEDRKLYGFCTDDGAEFHEVYVANVNNLPVMTSGQVARTPRSVRQLTSLVVGPGRGIALAAMSGGHARLYAIDGRRISGRLPPAAGVLVARASAASRGR